MSDGYRRLKSRTKPGCSQHPLSELRDKRHHGHSRILIWSSLQTPIPEQTRNHDSQCCHHIAGVLSLSDSTSAVARPACRVTHIISRGGLSKVTPSVFWGTGCAWSLCLPSGRATNAVLSRMLDDGAALYYLKRFAVAVVGTERVSLAWSNPSARKHWRRGKTWAQPTSLSGISESSIWFTLRSYIGGNNRSH